jgi:xylulokinase
LCAKDYIIAKLTGKYVTDASDASGTNAFDLNTFSWSADILHAADISMDKFPDVLKSTDIAGRVTAKAALECGLLEGTPVVTGGGDGVCASVGAGSIAPGITYNCLGSSSWICTVSEKPLLDDKMRLFNWAHVVPGLIAPCGTMQAAGASFNWAVKEIFKAENIRGLHGSSSYDHINTAIAKSRTGANGLIFLPYLMGERAPRWNPNARGCFIGLKMDTKNEDMLRAVVEGVAMNLKIILSLLTERIEINEMIVMGGLARSRVIRSILADVYGMNICKLNLLEEGTSLGAAVTAGVGIGALNGFEDVNKFTQAETEEPYNRKNHQVYQKIQTNFNEAYFSLLKVFDNLAAQQLAE